MKKPKIKFVELEGSVEMHLNGERVAEMNTDDPIRDPAQYMQKLAETLAIKLGATLTMKVRKAKPRDRVPVGTYGRLETKKGVAIKGTWEAMTGVALLEGGTRQPNGDIVPEHEGGTNVNWDGQVTYSCLGQTLFLDENGDICTARDVRVVAERR